MFFLIKCIWRFPFVCYLTNRWSFLQTLGERKTLSFLGYTRFNVLLSFCDFRKIPFCCQEQHMKKRGRTQKFLTWIATAVNNRYILMLIGADYLAIIKWVNWDLLLMQHFFSLIAGKSNNCFSDSWRKWRPKFWIFRQWFKLGRP